MIGEMRSSCPARRVRSDSPSRSVRLRNERAETRHVGRGAVNVGCRISMEYSSLMGGICLLESYPMQGQLKLSRYGRNARPRHAERTEDVSIRYL